MPSSAAAGYFTALERARLLRSLSGDPRLRPVSHGQEQTYCHAALAANVAA
jgi:hypothetical protein